ncbi:TGF-beta-activated kinase 1 and MAP3K7-binding protein 1-like isoform X2 [Babylonia areolata]|uniref:TGF-beta-activated kinase 1 and MAP3K7-binding protein 1-like isoform X2 n=1 Tax=Babylonia areolata TaxID=304850 RepID=UPI003FD6BAC2
MVNVWPFLLTKDCVCCISTTDLWAMSNGRLPNGALSSAPRLGMQGQVSWTDDLPVCYLSGVGLSTNQIYREDGNRREEHDCEDRNFHFRHDSNCYLYGVFDGHNGSRVADFAAQRMPAELLLGQLQNKTTDAEIREVLRQAFMAVENVYFESTDGLLAEKTTTQDRLPDGISSYEACSKYPDVYSKLQQLEQQLSGGTTATLVLIYNNKIYVANVGDTRALLVKTGQDGVLTVMQLSNDHTLDDPMEHERLSGLGLDVEKLRTAKKIGNSTCTRCIGDYHVKGGYRDIDYLSAATKEPVIADPFVDGGTPVDDSCAFLIIMSDGLYQSLTDATNSERVNADIASMVATEFSMQTTLNGVAQAVVDKVVRFHHDTYMTGTPQQKRVCQKRDDITLMVRQFKYPLSTHSPTGGLLSYHPSPSTPLYQPQPPRLPALHIPTPHPPPFSHLSTGEASSSDSPKTPTNQMGGLGAGVSSSGSGSNSYYLQTESTMSGRTHTSSSTCTSEDSTQSSGEVRMFASRRVREAEMELDAEGKVKPYVDFSEFFRALEQMSEEQQNALMSDMRPRSMYDPIQEEGESLSLPEM